jgi:hypothetical protein
VRVCVCVGGGGWTWWGFTQLWYSTRWRSVSAFHAGPIAHRHAPQAGFRKAPCRYCSCGTASLMAYNSACACLYLSPLCRAQAAAASQQQQLLDALSKQAAAAAGPAGTAASCTCTNSACAVFSCCSAGRKQQHPSSSSCWTLSHSRQQQQAGRNVMLWLNSFLLH